MTFAPTATATGVRFAVKVVPGASRDRIAGVLGDALKVQVAAPPEDGKANRRLCEVLAAALGVAVRDVAVASGQHMPRKIVEVRGRSPEDVLEQIR